MRGLCICVNVFVVMDPLLQGVTRWVLKQGQGSGTFTVTGTLELNNSQPIHF